jgi:hypothetical protein
MWHTEVGNRVLTGAEAGLFREGLCSLVDCTDEWPEQSTGVRIFDRLSQAEKLAILDEVSYALLVRRVPCPILTAVNEGAIAAIYYQINIDVEEEIDTGQTRLRKLIRQACQECALEEELPRLKSCESEVWREKIDELMFRVLWDIDWEGGFIEPDDAPDKANALREYFGIHPEYYTAVPPDPNPTQLTKIRARLYRLMR